MVVLCCAFLDPVRYIPFLPPEELLLGTTRLAVLDAIQDISLIRPVELGHPLRRRDLDRVFVCRCRRGGDKPRQGQGVDDEGEDPHLALINK